MVNKLIRQMVTDDIDGVYRLEEATFAVPWKKEIFLQELTKNKFAHYFVYTVDDTIIGYVGTWIVMDEVQITNIAILPAYRGQKYGETLFQYVIEYARTLGAAHLSLEVRVSNIIAQKMYRKFGLVPGGIRKRYYTDNQEDAIVMWVNLNEK